MKARSVRRLLLGLAAGGALAFVGLLGATALVLRSDWLLGQIDAEPDSLFVAFTSPRASCVPGRVRFATLTLRSRDSNVEWEAVLEDATVDVALFGLVRRTFHSTKVRAAALTFRLRERLTRAEATPARAARYPPIAGFADPPLRGPAEPPAAPRDPWRVAVDDLRVALVRGIWIDAWRWEGTGGLSGGFRLTPGIVAQVLRSELAVESGTLHWGGDVVSRNASGRVGAWLPRFDTQAFPGNEVWKIMSGSASLDGTLEAVSFLSPEGGGPRLAGGGSARVRFSMADGRGGGTVGARLPDGRPLIALLPAGPPKWIAGLIDLQDVHATARLRIAPGVIAVSPARLRAGSLAVHADFRHARGRDWGALLVRKGALAVGFGLGTAKSVHVLGAVDWFEAEGRPGGLRTGQPRGSVEPVRVSR